MTVIQSIRPAGSISVVDFDDGTSFRCTRDFLSRSQLSRGQQIDPIIIERLRETASSDLALSQSRSLNSRGRFGRNEIAVKLQQAGLSHGEINSALDRLEAEGELDDRSVALEVARRSLKRDMNRNPDLTWRGFHNRHSRRLALRGFAASVSTNALRRAWSEIEAL
jgi:hypothetical protein